MSVSQMLHSRLRRLGWHGMDGTCAATRSDRMSLVRSVCNGAKAENGRTVGSLVDKSLLACARKYGLAGNADLAVRRAGVDY